MTPRQPPPEPATLTGGRSQLAAWLLFAPPLLMAGLRWLLQQADDRVSATPAPALVPVATTTTLELVWPALVALAVLVALGLLVRRIGWRRFMPVLGVAWALFWLAACGALLQQHFNREGLVLQGVDAAAVSSSAPAATIAPAATVLQAKVVTVKFKPPSARSLGGTELVLQVTGLEVPQRLLLNDAKAASLKPGDALTLQLVPGRFKGQFVVGWQQAMPLAPPAPLPPGATP